MRIQVLFSEGCPHVAATVARLRDVLLAEHVAAMEHIEQLDVGSSPTSFPPGFRGSPTVLINGCDIAGDELPRRVEGSYCRLYPGAANSGVPPEDLIRNAVRRARAQESR